MLAGDFLFETDSFFSFLSPSLALIFHLNIFPGEKCVKTAADWICRNEGQRKAVYFHIKKALQLRSQRKLRHKMSNVSGTGVNHHADYLNTFLNTWSHKNV